MNKNIETYKNAKINQKKQKITVVDSKPAQIKQVDIPIDTRTPGQKFSDEIRAEYNRKKNADYQRIFGRAKSNTSLGSGNGRWVTIDGNHVFMER